MQLNDLLTSESIDPKQVIVFRHRPKEPELRKALPWLAHKSPDVYNAYQQTQGPIVEKALPKAKYVASFIGHEAGKALFVGLYELRKTTRLTFDKYWKIRANNELHKLGILGLKKPSDTILWFDLHLLPFRSEWKGKLILQWTGLERSWWRWADRNNLQIHAIAEESLLDRDMPDWKDIVLSWQLLEAIPLKWQYKMSQWRGIYYVFDVSDGKGYVGAAYGEENLLSRWMSYSKAGHGGNKHLRGRDPKNFQFSILQILQHDVEATAVQALETSWKKRLHTRGHGLNDN